MKKFELKTLKISNRQAEINVCNVVKEALNHGNSTSIFSNIESLYHLKSYIDNQISQIKKTNSYDPVFSYKTKLEDNVLEVWKIKSDGDYNYKMFEIIKL
jgi:hypothetical protein